MPHPIRDKTMKLICELNDAVILGAPGMSAAAPRLTARAIVRNTDGLYAVMYAEKFDLYSLPGGGVEDGEDILSALTRELREETGCLCKEIIELGIVTENRRCQNYTQENHYYFVSAAAVTEPKLTQAEQENRTHLLWRPFEEAYHLIADAVHTTAQGKYLQARDVAALHAYREGKQYAAHD